MGDTFMKGGLVKLLYDKVKGDSGSKKKDPGYDAYKALQYQKAPTDTTMMTQSSVPSLMPKEAKIKQSRTNSLNAMRAGSFGLMK